jgi:glucose-1-phosphate cytidylyltransferase
VKERAQLEEMYHRGVCPWMIWDPDRSGGTPPAPAALPATGGSGSAASAPTPG